MLVSIKEICQPDTYFRINKIISLCSPHLKWLKHFLGKKSILPKNFATQTWRTPQCSPVWWQWLQHSPKQGVSSTCRTAGSISCHRKEIDRFCGQTQLTLKQGRDVALGKHLSVGACCFLEVGLRCLNTGFSLRCSNASCVIPRRDHGKMWITCRSGVLPPQPHRVPILRHLYLGKGVKVNAWGLQSQNSSWQHP